MSNPLVKELFLGSDKKISLNVIFFHVALIFTSFSFVYTFSYSTSFGYSLLGGDSAVFQAVGKLWLEGVIPFKEIFDHKGPIVHLINAIGYAIYPRAGIMVPQIIFLYLSCLFVWRAMELYWQGRIKIFFLLLTLIYYAAHYEEGNHVAEYSVLFLSAASWCFLRVLKNSEGEKFFHPPMYGFVYGFGFGACVLIRTSDAAQICCQTFLVAIFLWQARAFKNLWQNFLSFCAGFVTICLPFVIYFAAHDALYDMIYGTLLFNLKYAGFIPPRLPIVADIIFVGLHFLPLFGMIIVAAFALKSKPKSRLFLSGIFIGTMMALMLIKLRHAVQYSMILFATAPIIFAVVKESRDELKNIWHGTKFSPKRFLVKLLVALTVLYFVLTTVYLEKVLLVEQNTLFFLFSAYDKRASVLNSNERENVLKLQAIIPEDERASFACWADYCTTPHWLLYTGMKPRERLFMNNTHLTTIDPQLREEWFRHVREDYPLWILYGTTIYRPPGVLPNKLTEDSELEKLLAEKYSFKGRVYIPPQMMNLYRLRDE